jgi:tRNA (uracil-5-)-methyltransferase TRM9
VADTLNLPHPQSYFDFAICIAVIHHLSTSSRRIKAVKAILELLKPGSCEIAAGKLLIFVWALEQKSSRRGWNTGDEQDVMVPWILKDSFQRPGAQKEDQTFHRYYHLYEKGELESNIAEAGGTTLESGYEKDNWWAICCPASKR